LKLSCSRTSDIYHILLMENGQSKSQAAKIQSITSKLQAKAVDGLARSSWDCRKCMCLRLNVCGRFLDDDVCKDASELTVVVGILAGMDIVPKNCQRLKPYQTKVR